MKKILFTILCLSIFVPLASGQELNLSKSVWPEESVVGDEILITITIQSNVSQKLTIIDKMPKAFDIASFDPRTTCSKELEPLTNTRIITCELDAKRSEIIQYGIVVREGGVFALPEVIVVTEDGERFRSRSNVGVLVGIPEQILITTVPPQTTVPPVEEFLPVKIIRDTIELARNFINTVFPESVRFFIFGLLLFLALILLIITPFYYFLGRYQEE